MNLCLLFSNCYAKTIIYPKIARVEINLRLSAFTATVSNSKYI